MIAHRAFTRVATLSLLGLLLLAATGCKGAEPTPEPSPAPAPALEPAPAPPPKEDKLVIFAAASLREAFTTLSKSFEQQHAGVELTFNFAGTQELRTQLDQGAAVDVFASADQRHMDELVKAKRVSGPAMFARNEPVVVVAKEQITKLKTFSDLPRAKKIVIGTPEVPIGRYTLQILERASQSLGARFRTQVEAHVVSRELNVKQVLAKVTLGEADAAIVYRTDANSSKDPIGIIEIPAEINVIAEYPIAVVTEAAHPTLAGDWVTLVLSDAGLAALSSAGFLPPTDTRPL